ncbi:hypothetical protein BaRGS_00022996 [Batillaria attramentaria]|uniref:Uncharacterized protein n=1 Tax=Batillaria attramentaria TaxID=370345 RepID=A0ABD0KF63_9CAEN
MYAEGGKPDHRKLEKRRYKNLIVYSPVEAEARLVPCNRRVRFLRGREIGSIKTGFSWEKFRPFRFHFNIRHRVGRATADWRAQHETAGGKETSTIFR